MRHNGLAGFHQFILMLVIMFAELFLNLRVFLDNLSLIRDVAAAQIWEIY